MPNYGATVAHTEAQDPPDLVTLGLKNDWQPVYDWATRHSVLPQLLLLAQVTHSTDQYTYIGTLLHALTVPTVRHLLSEWSALDPYCESLLFLADAVRNDPTILDTCPPAPGDVSVRKQLHRSMPTRFLLAAFISDLNLETQEQIDRYWSLRVWLLVEAFRRGADGVLLDGNIREVATRLCIAIEKEKGWRPVFDRLPVGAKTFGGFRRFLRTQAQRLSNDESLETTLGLQTRRTLLGKLSKITNDAIIDITPSLPGALTGTRALLRVPIGPPPPMRREELDKADGEVSRIESEDADNDLLSHQDSEPRSYLHSLLKGNSILNLTGEQLHYLPWAWDRPNPYELIELNHWLDRHLALPPNGYNALLSAIVWIAMATGRSLLRALDLPISYDIAQEWTLIPKTWMLKRQIPRRDSSWTPTEQSSGWVVPAAEYQTLTLPDRIILILRKARRRNTKAQYLGQLWSHPEGSAPKTCFTAEMIGPLARITSSMLSQILPQRAYETRSDAYFSRLIAAHPQSALPAPCAYTAWTLTDVTAELEAGKSETPPQPLTAPGALIGMGSLLFAVEQMLVKTISKANRRVREAILSGDPIIGHNTYIAHLIAAMLAATGGRPIRDPFESPAHFDPEQRFVFVNDKESSLARQGRLNPLPDELCHHLVHDYSDYLTRLAESLREVHPELAAEIDVLSDQRSNGRLPWFFFLAQTPGLRWISVSESEIEKLELYDWPLPLRLFRHRLANQLRLRRVHAEIIDGLLGHSEVGAASYGDDSPRCWMDDMVETRPAINSCYQDLGFSLTAPPVIRFDLNLTKYSLSKERLFGARAREHQRQQRRRAAFRAAKEALDDLLEGRTFDEVEPDEIEQLAERLLGIHNGTPSDSGYLQYQYLESKVEKLRNRRGRWLRTRKRFYSPSEAPSLITEAAVGALSRYHALLAQLRKDIAGLKIKRLPYRDCFPLAATLILLETGITSKSILEGVLEGNNIRLVSKSGLGYLEYAPGLAELVQKEPESAITVQRFRIPKPAVDLIARGLRASRQSPERKTGLPRILTQLSAQLNAYADVYCGNTETTIGGLIESLRLLVDQVSAMTRPGIVAAVTSGRRISVSLRWSDWLRRDGNGMLAVESPLLQSTNDEKPPIPFAWSAAVVRSARDVDKEAQLDNAHAFYKALRGAIPQTGSRSMKGKKGRRLPKYLSPAQRARVVSNLNSILSEWSGRVSGAVYMLGQWLLYLTIHTRTTNARLKPNTPKRYFGALSPVFQQLGHNVELNSLSSDEVTEFYRELLEARPNLKDRKYVEWCLLEFHRWALQFGICEPDWPDLPMSISLFGISPGYFSETEYFDALSKLLIAPGDDQQVIASAALLLFCYRFALRPGEALGLTRNDIQIWDDDIVIVVRERYLRSVKQTRSRRQTPLVFTLSAQERSILDRLFGLAEAAHGQDKLAPIFSDTDMPRDVNDISGLIGMVTRALRETTGNPNVVLYTARHSCAAEVAMALYDLDLPGWTEQIKEPREIRHDRIRRILLGGKAEARTRRCAWVLARFMGHAGPETAPKSYLHFVTEWTDELNALSETPWKYAPTGVMDLDTQPRVTSIDYRLLHTAKPSPKPLTVVSALKWMRLIASGNPADRAADLIGISQKASSDLYDAASAIGERLRLSNTKRDRRVVSESEKSTKSSMPRTPNDPLEYLRRPPDSAWNRLIKKAAEIDGKKVRLNSAPTLATLPLMIGATRQLLICRKPHFHFAFDLLNLLGYPRKQYKVIMGKGKAETRNLLRTWADEAGLKPSTQDTTKPKLDSMFELTEDGVPRPAPERWGIAWIETADPTIAMHSSIEWVIMVLAIVSALSANDKNS